MPYLRNVLGLWLAGVQKRISGAETISIIAATLSWVAKPASQVATLSCLSKPNCQAARQPASKVASQAASEQASFWDSQTDTWTDS